MVIKNSIDPPFHHITAVSSRLSDQNDLWPYSQCRLEIFCQLIDGETRSNAEPPPGCPQPQMEIVPRELPETTVKLEISPYLKEDDTLEISAAKPPILAGEIVKARRLIQSPQDFAVHGKMSVQHPIMLKQETDKPMSCSVSELTKI